MWTHQAYIALQLAMDDRVREADQYRLAAEYRAGHPTSRRSIRRSIAAGLASISSAAASAARRLDERVGADRAEQNVPNELAARH
jgi:hypothetical protein